jgi:hypothetical protein
LKLHKVVYALFLVALIGLVPLFSTANAATEDFEDDFETGNLSNWSGYRASTGETIGASSYRSYLGAYGGRATTNGDGGVEYAYTYQRLSSSELYVRGLFYVAQSGLVQDGDRFYLMALQSGQTTLASLGWRVIDGQVKWFLAVNGADGWTINYSSDSSIPAPNKWYSIQLYWKMDATNGESKLWIEQPYWLDNSPVCQVTNKNTAANGPTNEIRVGLPTVSYCDKTAVYYDNIKTSNAYIQPIYDIGWSVTNFKDSFSSGNLNAWSQIKTWQGVAYTVHYPAETGFYCAKFATVNYGVAYCTKNIALADDFDRGSRLFEANGAFYIWSCNINHYGGRLYLFRAWDENTEVIAAGIEKTPDGLRWFMDRKDGTETVTVYSTNSPVQNEWVFLTINWNPFEYSWGVTCCDLQIENTDGNTETLHTPGQNTIVYDTITRIDMGITKALHCPSAEINLDAVNINSHEWE